MLKSLIITKEAELEARLLIHPGEILKEEFLVPFGLSANRLAKAIGVPTNRITEIVNGSRGITGETAVLLGHAFGTTSEFWLNLQSRYELDLANTRVPRDAIRRADAFNRGLRAA